MSKTKKIALWSIGIFVLLGAVAMAGNTQEKAASPTAAQQVAEALETVPVPAPESGYSDDDLEIIEFVDEYADLLDDCLVECEIFIEDFDGALEDGTLDEVESRWSDSLKALSAMADLYAETPEATDPDIEELDRAFGKYGYHLASLYACLADVGTSALDDSSMATFNKLVDKAVTQYGRCLKAQTRLDNARL